MTFKLAADQASALPTFGTETVGTELRQCVVETLAEMLSVDERIVVLEADLGGASGWSKLAADHAERFLNVGIAEANMVGVAAGLSLTGYIPYLHTFGPFATRRVFDQLYLAGGYSQTTLNIYGSDPGFTAGTNGGTHTTWEDVALLRMIPETVICDAADEIQMRWIIKAFSQSAGIHYVRGNRKAVARVYEDGSTFELGKGNLLQQGSEVLLIASGQLVADTLIAAKNLAAKEISCAVIDMFTIKPLDRELILQEIAGKSLVVTIENHSIYGGLGSSVAELIAEENISVSLKRIGVDEVFGQVGSPQFLQDYFGLSSQKIQEKIEAKLVV